MKFWFGSVVTAIFLTGCNKQALDLPNAANDIAEIDQSLSVVEFQGTVEGFNFDEYPIELNANDSITAVIDNSNLDVIVFAPVEARLENNTRFIATFEGSYRVRVLMSRARARRGELHSYKLNITIHPG